jgi:hypothetical protein
VAYNAAPNVAYLADVMARFGLANKCAYRFPMTSQWFGRSDTERIAVLKSAELLINTSGTLAGPEDYRQIQRLAYIDSEPVFAQVKLARGEVDFRQRVNAHDVHFSFGEGFSDAVPATGRHWRATRQPIVLSEWRLTMPQRNVSTTVMSWTSYKPLTYRGQTCGQKDAEFKRFLELPSKVAPVVLEVALNKTYYVKWQTMGISIPG